MMKRIAIIELQNIKYASRARKEAFSLSSYYKVFLLGADPYTNKNIIENNVNIIQYRIPYLITSSRIKKAINIFKFNYKIFIWLMKNNVDLVIMHNIKPMISVITSKKLKHFNIIYDAHELHFNKRTNNNLIDNILKWIDYINEKIILRHSKIVFQASYERAKYFANLHKTSIPIVIENHANYVSVDPNIDIGNIFNNLPQGTKNIIYTGNISWGGNQRIDKVICSLKYLDSSIHFCILGIGDLNIKQRLIQYARTNGVENRIHYIDPVKSELVVNVISKANVAVIPIYAICLNSKYSALNKLSQSLMAGLPIACSNYENLRKLVFENEVGQVGDVFDVMSPRSIAQAINNCLQNENTYRQRALELAKVRLNWEVQEEKLLKAVDLALRNNINT